MADFITEFTLIDNQGAKKIPLWNIYTNGSSYRQAGGVGVVLFSPEEDKIEAEYEALIAGLDLARVAGAENMIIHCDSQVVTSQVNSSYECKKERMQRYLNDVKGRIGSL